MNDHDDDDTQANYSEPAPADRFADVLTLLAAVRNAKATEAALKRLRKLGRDIDAAEQKLAALTAQMEQTNAELAARAAAADEREAAMTQREDEFASSVKDTYAELRQYHDSLAQTDRHIRFRIASSAGLLHGFNEQLQELPTWDQLKRLVVGLPDDPSPLEREVVSHPRIDAFSDVCSDPGADRHGNVFLGTLSRDISHHRARE